MGKPVLILAFVVIVIGDISSVRGEPVSRILVGLVDTMGFFLLPKELALMVTAAQAGLIGASLAHMLIYIIMALILAFRPSFLFAAQS